MVESALASAVRPAILLIRLSAIGDVVMASGLIAPLRARYPNARIGWLVQPEAKGLLEANPAIDEVIVWPRGEWRKLLRAGRVWRLFREVNQFVRELRARRYDTVIDLQGLLKSGIWAWLSRARARIGLGSKEGSQWLMTRVVARSREHELIGLEYRDLARTLDLPAEEFHMHVGVTDADEAYIKELLRHEGVTGRYAVFCPFTTRPQKHWFNDRWLELAQRLPGELGMTVVMVGGPGDQAAAVALSRPGVVNLVGRTSLRQAAALIRSAALLVGVDTGLTHVGTAFEIPTVALFGSTRPYLKTDSPKTQVLYHRLDCSPCHRNPTCAGRFDCMRHIQVDEIMQTARRLIA